VLVPPTCRNAQRRQKWKKPHENDIRQPPPLPPTDFFALPLQARAGLCATLRGQPGLALQSKKIGIRQPAQQKKKACQPAKNLRPMPRQPVLQSFNNLTEIKIPPIIGFIDPDFFP
jgi:hypothetical protein